MAEIVPHNLDELVVCVWKRLWKRLWRRINKVRITLLYNTTRNVHNFTMYVTTPSWFLIAHRRQGLHRTSFSWGPQTMPSPRWYLLAFLKCTWSMTPRAVHSALIEWLRTQLFLQWQGCNPFNVVPGAWHARILRFSLSTIVLKSRGEISAIYVACITNPPVTTFHLGMYDGAFNDFAFYDETAHSQGRCRQK